MTKKLLFVYNANSDFFSVALDGLHKAIRPSTYQCQLCALTWGRVSMKREWKEFTKKLPMEVEFLHADKLAKRFPDEKAQLPAVFIENNSSLEQILSADDFVAMSSLDDLMSALQNHLKIKS